jgi:hypothetical protein
MKASRRPGRLPEGELADKMNAMPSTCETTIDGPLVEGETSLMTAFTRSPRRSSILTATARPCSAQNVFPPFSDLGRPHLVNGNPEVTDV